MRCQHDWHQILETVNQFQTSRQEISSRREKTFWGCSKASSKTYNIPLDPRESLGKIGGLEAGEENLHSVQSSYIILVGNDMVLMQANVISKKVNVDLMAKGPTFIILTLLVHAEFQRHSSLNR